MEGLIREAWTKWKAAKEAARASCEESGHLEMARKLGECGMFKGNETIREIVNLMFTPRGMEFLTTYRFPDMGTFRKFKKYGLKRLGVYIDSGKVELSEARRVFLVGRTSAKLYYNDTKANRVCMMHGASAVIIASGYSVVKVEKDETCNVSVITQDNAVVI